MRSSVRAVWFWSEEPDPVGSSSRGEAGLREERPCCLGCAPHHWKLPGSREFGSGLWGRELFVALGGPRSSPTTEKI